MRCKGFCIVGMWVTSKTCHLSPPRECNSSDRTIPSLKWKMAKLTPGVKHLPGEEWVDTARCSWGDTVVLRPEVGLIFRAPAPHCTPDRLLHHQSGVVRSVGDPAGASHPIGAPRPHPSTGGTRTPTLVFPTGPPWGSTQAPPPARGWAEAGPTLAEKEL